jgi:hypothetical protein
MYLFHISNGYRKIDIWIYLKVSHLDVSLG